jgi:hypothetical protein
VTSFLGIAHRHALGHDLVGQLDLGGRIDRQQRAGMAHVDIAGHEHGLHRLGQVQQAQQVAHRAARTAHGQCRLLVGEGEIGDEAMDALRFFQRVQVLALHVLDQRHGGGGLVVHVLDQHRHFGQAGDLGRAEAALAGDDLVDVRPFFLPMARTRMGCSSPVP